MPRLTCPLFVFWRSRIVVVVVVWDKTFSDQKRGRHVSATARLLGLVALWPLYMPVPPVDDGWLLFADEQRRSWAHPAFGSAFPYISQHHRLKRLNHGLAIFRFYNEASCKANGP
jgi:hypothetical protein